MNPQYLLEKCIHTMVETCLNNPFYTILKTTTTDQANGVLGGGKSLSMIDTSHVLQSYDLNESAEYEWTMLKGEMESKGVLLQDVAFFLQPDRRTLVLLDFKHCIVFSPIPSLYP